MIPSTILTTRRSAKALAVLLGLAAAVSGCWPVADAGGPPPPLPVTPVPENIDTGANMDVMGGQKTGVFVEYAGGGDWHVYTACNVAQTGRSCVFDIVLSTPATSGFANPMGTDLEPIDTVTLEPDGSIHLIFETLSSLDGVTFSTAPGADVQVTTILDDASRPDLVTWVSLGVVHDGAPSDPVDFTPNQP